LRISKIGEVKTTTKRRSTDEEGAVHRRADHWRPEQHEAGRRVPELAREIGVSDATIYTWKSKYGGMEVNEAIPALRDREQIVVRTNRTMLERLRGNP
jgi:putative transposase